MSAKKGRGAKVPTVRPEESQKASSFDRTDTPNLSVIDKASFLEGLQKNYGNPLHSTAMEEDLNVFEEGEMHKGEAEAAKKGKRKQIETDEEEEKKKKKRKSRRSTGEKVKSRPEKEAESKKKKREPEGERARPDASAIPQTSSHPAPKDNSHRRLVGKKPAKRRSAGKTSEVRTRPLKNQQMKDTKRKSKSNSGKSSGPESQEDSDSGAAQQSRRRIPSSEEEVDEDTSWNPSPKKAKVHGFGGARKSSSDRSKSRKSSSGSASTEPEKSNTDKERRRGHGGQGGTDLEVVLDAFLDFCEQYRESVESKAVKKSIDCFSSNVKEQLLEKISSHKELRVLKRENAKVGSSIRRKRQRLLDAKQELMRADRQMWLLQKEKAELKLRLADLRQSHAFLHDLRELNRQYLDYRHQHPKEKETYGASSFPALLLEAKHIQAAEHQLRGINNQMEKILDKNRT